MDAAILRIYVPLPDRAVQREQFRLRFRGLQDQLCLPQLQQRDSNAEDMEAEAVAREVRHRFATSLLFSIVCVCVMTALTSQVTLDENCVLLLWPPRWTSSRPGTKATAPCEREGGREGEEDRQGEGQQRRKRRSFKFTTSHEVDYHSHLVDYHFDS